MTRLREREFPRVMVDIAKMAHGVGECQRIVESAVESYCFFVVSASSGVVVQLAVDFTEGAQGVGERGLIVLLTEKFDGGGPCGLRVGEAAGLLGLGGAVDQFAGLVRHREPYAEFCAIPVGDSRAIGNCHPDGGGPLSPAGMEGPAVRHVAEWLSTAGEPQIPRLHNSAPDDNSKIGRYMHA